MSCCVTKSLDVNPSSDIHRVYVPTIDPIHLFLSTMVLASRKNPCFLLSAWCASRFRSEKGCCSDTVGSKTQIKY